MLGELTVAFKYIPSYSMIPETLGLTLFNVFHPIPFNLAYYYYYYGYYYYYY